MTHILTLRTRYDVQNEITEDVNHTVGSYGRCPTVALIKKVCIHYFKTFGVTSVTVTHEGGEYTVVRNYDDGEVQINVLTLDAHG